MEQIGCHIEKEDIVFEDGKFYPMMKVSCKKKADLNYKSYNKNKQVFYHYGEDLLRSSHPVLYDFLVNEKKLYEEILEKLCFAKTEKIEIRIKELKEKIDLIHQGLEWFSNEM